MIVLSALLSMDIRVLLVFGIYNKLTEISAQNHGKLSKIDDEPVWVRTGGGISMIESTARAERYDLQTSKSPFYLWEVPQKPVAVRIPFNVIDRLEREAVEAFRSLSSRGSEIGGLLVGDVTAGSPLVVSIADYELVSCDYARGPLYRLAEADMERFQRAMEQQIGRASCRGRGWS